MVVPALLYQCQTQTKSGTLIYMYNYVYTQSINAAYKINFAAFYTRLHTYIQLHWPKARQNYILKATNKIRL